MREYYNDDKRKLSFVFDNQVTIDDENCNRGPHIQLQPTLAMHT